MKKTIITTALVLGLASFSSAADYTLGDTTYTTTTGITNGQGYFSNRSSFTFTLSNALFNGTQSGINAITTASDSSSSFASNTVALDKIHFSFYGGAGNLAAVQISQGDTIVATSTNRSYSATGAATDVFTGETYNNRIQQTWQFDENTVALTLGTTYTITFLNSSSEATGVTLEVSYCDDDTQAAFVGTANNHSYQPAGLVITTLSTVPVSSGGAIPEPTTATLSLLALAGLAARRRRK